MEVLREALSCEFLQPEPNLVPVPSWPRGAPGRAWGSQAGGGPATRASPGAADCPPPVPALGSPRRLRPRGPQPHAHFLRSPLRPSRRHSPRLMPLSKPGRLCGCTLGAVAPVRWAPVWAGPPQLSTVLWWVVVPPGSGDPCSRQASGSRGVGGSFLGQDCRVEAREPGEAGGAGAGAAVGLRPSEPVCQELGLRGGPVGPEGRDSPVLEWGAGTGAGGGGRAWGGRGSWAGARLRAGTALAALLVPWVSSPGPEGLVCVATCRLPRARRSKRHVHS